MDEDRGTKVHNRNPLAVFALRPLDVSFEFQEKGEVIILLLRAHLITLVPALLIALILFFIPFALPTTFGIFNIDLAAVFSPRQTFGLLTCWYLFTFGWAFYRFVFWYFNVYLLTNERFIDFDFRGILHKEIAYANLTQVEDVSPKTIGFFGTFFHFGNVFIQTAGAKPEFEFHNVAKPEAVAQEILQQVRLEEAEPPGEIK